MKHPLRLALLFAVCMLLVPLSSLGQAAQVSAAARQKAVRESAEKGDAKAQYELGISFEFGFGEEKNQSEALRWYRKAAEKGFTDARFALARIYFEGTGVQQNFTESARWYGCPEPAVDILNGCKSVKYEDLPRDASEFLEHMKCEVSVYNNGSAVDLNNDGTPEYQVCCHDAPHGPCTAVVIGMVGSEWKNLSAGPSLGYSQPCAEFVVLAREREGFHDICLPRICSPQTPKACVPTLWEYRNGRYHQTGRGSVSRPR